MPSSQYLTPHFSLTELTASQTAARRGIDNTPNAEHRRNLKRLAQTLEQVRSLLGNRAVLVSSGYRGPALNTAIGGSRTSAHMSGLAADFTVPGFGTVFQTARAIAASDIVYDQLIHEYGSWVHLGLAADGATPRRQNLSIFTGTGYLNGIVGRPSA